MHLLFLWGQSMKEITPVLLVVKTFVSVFADRGSAIKFRNGITIIELLHFFPLALGFGEVFIVHMVH